MSHDETAEIIAERVDKIACRKCGRHMDVSSVEPFSKVDCPDCDTRQRVPMRLGNFLLLEVLGKGGMGVVYRALDQSLGRYVAFKVLRRALGEDKHFIENFFREARAAAALNHPNVVQIYSCGEERGQPYIVMELVGGGRLDAIVSEGNPMDEVRALEVGVDVTEGLKAANDIGLIHGDIKPANILIDDHGTAKVVDFGLARFVNWKQEQEPGEIWGTPYYIAPEKARGQKVDHRSDIYSLGATLYHALGAKPPFDGKTATDVVLARLKNPAIGLRVIRPSLQPETADVISRTLESDPFMRYPTYASLLPDLREALRVAKQESRAHHHVKVKKSTVGPLVVVSITVVAALAFVIGALQYVNKPKKKQARPRPQPIQQVIIDEVPKEEPVEVLKDRRVPPTVQPFSGKEAQAVVDAAHMLADGKLLATEERLQHVYEGVAPNTMGRFWVRLFQAVPCWYDGRDKSATVYLEDILQARFEVTVDDLYHPGTLLKALARYSLGVGDEGILYIEAARWPVWTGDVVEFFVGINQLRRDRLGEARTHLKAYVAKTPSGAKWPYAFQPLARRLLGQLADWEALYKDVSNWIAQMDSTKAAKALDDFRTTASAVFHPMIDRAVISVQQAQQREATERDRQKKLVHQEDVQKELDLLDEVRTANYSLVAQKNYRKASAALSKVLPKMKTAEGRETFKIMQESYERMTALKRFIIRSIEKKPFQEAGNELGGRAIGANRTGIKISLRAGRGVMVKPWDQISVRLMIQMAYYYISNGASTDQERGDQLVSVAVLCYYNGGFKAASKYAGQAVESDPTVKPNARRLMPDILPN